MGWFHPHLGQTTNQTTLCGLANSQTRPDHRKLQT
jgi:hypothetical protein